jgi:hypothetical protein
MPKFVAVAIVVTFEQRAGVNAVHLAFMSVSWQTTTIVKGNPPN